LLRQKISFPQNEVQGNCFSALVFTLFIAIGKELAAAGSSAFPFTSVSARKTISFVSKFAGIPFAH
jgi:hypothetical protein